MTRLEQDQAQQIARLGSRVTALEATIALLVDRLEKAAGELEGRLRAAKYPPGTLLHLREEGGTLRHVLP